MSGAARPNDSWTRTSLPHIRTGIRSIAQSMHFASVHTRRTQTTNASGIREGAAEDDYSPSESTDGVSTADREGKINKRDVVEDDLDVEKGVN
jgi:hypothetical protein